jgi:hypothetical protein
MNPRSSSRYYAHQSAATGRQLGSAISEASLFRSLLAETDAALRAAHAAGKLPAGIISDDLIERTRAALAGESRPMTVTEAVNAAAARLEREATERAQ